MKTPIALLINDIHISKDNIADFKLNWAEALRICDEEEIGEIIIGGDMFTSRSSQTLATLLAVREALTDAVVRDIYVTIAEGNHDLVDQEACEGYNHLWRGLKNVEVIDAYKAMRWDGCDFALIVMSYFPENGSFLDWLGKAVDEMLKAEPDLKKSDIILYIHEGVHGALGDFEIEGELPQEPLKGFKAVLCGHYHNRVKIKGTNIEYIGASRQHNFGEDEEKGYTILYSDGSYSFVKNHVNIRYKSIEVDAKDVMKLRLDRDERYRYKVKVKCSEKEAKNFNKQQLFDLGFHKVEVKSTSAAPTSMEASDIQEKYDKQGIKKEYLKFCDENSIDSQLGIKYLED